MVYATEVSSHEVDKSNLIKMFKNREIRANKVFKIKPIKKSEAFEFVRKNHYLKDAKFFSEKQFGLFIGGEIVGSATYSRPQGNVALKGWFGLPNSDSTVLELSRLAIHPELNGSNATSYLLRNSIKHLKKDGIRAVITLADSNRHVGSIYQVCGFQYFGLTSPKSDFWRFDGKKNPRGSTKNVRGVWVPRSRKHRYAVILDKSLDCLYDEHDYPTTEDTTQVECCGGAKTVIDKRFGDEYGCPVCNFDEFN